MLNIFFPGIAPFVSILLFPKNIDDFSLLIQKKNLQQIQGILWTKSFFFIEIFFLGIPDFFNFVLV